MEAVCHKSNTWQRFFLTNQLTKALKLNNSTLSKVLKSHCFLNQSLFSHLVMEEDGLVDDLLELGVLQVVAHHDL